MTKNAAKLAVNEVKKGNPLPLAGFVLAHALGIAALTSQEELLRRLGLAIVKARDNKAKRVDTDAQGAIGDFMPDYWKTTPKYTWESEVDGKKVLRTVIVGGWTAWPTDDMIGGLYSYLKNSKGLTGKETFDNIVDQTFGNMFHPNMLIGAGFQALTGKSSSPAFPDKPGLVDIYKTGLVESIQDAAGRKILKDIALDLGTRFIPISYARNIPQLAAAVAREKAGQKPLPGQKTSEEILNNMLSLMRIETYDKDRAVQAVAQTMRTIIERKHIKSMAESKGAISKEKRAIKEQDAATEEQGLLADAGEERRTLILNEMRTAYVRAQLAFKSLDVDDTELKKAMAGLVSKQELRYVQGYRDEIPEYKPKIK